MSISPITKSAEPPVDTCTTRPSSTESSACCTPSPLTSGPDERPRAAILSISSIRMMPRSAARRSRPAAWYSVPIAVSMRVPT